MKVTLEKIKTYGLYLFLFLLPLQTRYIFSQGMVNGSAWEYGTISVYLTELLLAVLFALTVATARSVARDEARSKKNRLFHFYFLMLGVLFFSAVSLLFAKNVAVGGLALVRIAEGLALVFVIARTEFSYRRAGAALVLSAVVQSFVALGEWILQYVPANKWLGMAQQVAGLGGVSVVESATSRWLRAYGTLPHPNMLGMFLAVCVILTVVLIFVSRSSRERAWYWAALALQLNGLFFTFSRGALVALGIGSIFLITFLLLSRDLGSKEFFARYIFVALTVFGLLAVINSDPVLTRLSATDRLEVKSTQERSLYLSQARELLVYNWLTGVGLGNYTVAVQAGREGMPGYDYQPVHNVYLVMLTEIGIVGACAFFLLLAEGFKVLYTFRMDYSASLLEVYEQYDKDDLYQRYNFEFHWFLGLGAVFLMFVAAFFFDHFYWTLYFGQMLWWTMAGLFFKQVGYLRK